MVFVYTYLDVESSNGLIPQLNNNMSRAYSNAISGRRQAVFKAMGIALHFAALCAPEGIQSIIVVDPDCKLVAVPALLTEVGSKVCAAAPISGHAETNQFCLLMHSRLHGLSHTLD